MKGLITKELIVFAKTKLLILVTLLVLCIGLLFVCNFMIATSDETSSSMPPEQYKQLISNLAAFVGLLLVFSFSGKDKEKSDTLLRTWPLNDKDIVIAQYPAALAQHLAGVLASVIYFTVGYFIELFSNPLDDYLEIGVILFFLGWLCESMLIPLYLSKLKQWQITGIVCIIILIPICVFVMLIQSSTEHLFKIINRFNDKSLLLMISSAILACACTPISARIAMSSLRKERI